MKKIAVFICAISMENQKKTIEGILRQAKEKGIVCYVFTCHINFLARIESQEGVYNIMRLPDLTQFDGCIIMKNTIQYTKIADELEQRIQLSGIPCVSIDQEIDGMGSVMVDNYKAQYDVIDYLVKECHVNTINYVAGYRGNADGEERKRAYMDALRKYRIPFDESNIYYGNYSLNSGMEAVDIWLSTDRRLPDAIVCANDQMAIGVIEQLQEAGYKVPEEILVTGFDGESICDAFRPQIATVDKHQDLCGMSAVDLLIEQWNGCSPRKIVVKATFRPSGSCGVLNHESIEIDDIRSQYVADSIIVRQEEDNIRNMVGDLAEVESLEDFYQALQRNIHIEDMVSCYLCMCDIHQIFYRENMENKNLLDLKNINTRYTDRVSIPMAFYQGKFTEFGEFPAGQILPSEASNGEKVDFYVINAVNYHNCCFGYFVTSNNYFALQSDLFFSWIANIGVAMENIRKLIIMKGLTNRLNDMWVFDTMTKLYNRAGFYNFVDDLLEELKRKEQMAYMLFIDLDGLKKINDTQGHEQGDAYICAMSEVIKKEKQRNDLAMRYGGDEFVIFGACQNRAEVDDLVSRLEMTIKEYSFGEECHTLEASIGVSVCPAKEIDDIQSFIHKADEKMYVLKKQKKAGGV